MKPAFLIVILIAFITSNYITYETTKDIMTDKFAVVLNGLKNGDFEINGYRFVSESDYRLLTCQNVGVIGSEPSSWLGAVSKNYSYQHINASDIYNISATHYSNQPMYWVEDWRTKVVWVVTSNISGELRQEPFVVDDIENLSVSVFSYIDTFESNDNQSRGE